MPAHSKKERWGLDMGCGNKANGRGTALRGRDPPSPRLRGGKHVAARESAVMPAHSKKGAMVAR